MLGEKSFEAKKKKYGKDLSKVMSHIRKGKKLSTFETVEPSDTQRKLY